MKDTKINRRSDRRCNMCIKKIKGECHPHSLKKAIECSRFQINEAKDFIKKEIDHD